MAGAVFHGTYRNGILLNNAKTQNPATVAASGYVTSIGVAILGASGVAWNLTNLGRIESKGTAIGVYLQSGGSIANGSATATKALLAGLSGTAVAIEHGTGKVTNFGTIENFTSTAIAVFLAGGTLQNGAPGATNALIKSPANAVLMRSAAGTVANFGTILGTGKSQAVYLGAGGKVTNFGKVTDAESSGVSFHNKPGVVANFGTIVSTASGTTGVGVYLQDGGVVTNERTGVIAASHNQGVSVEGAAGSIVNFGTIQGANGTAGEAVFLGHGGHITNGESGSAGGLISGRRSGVVLDNLAGTVVNFGTIASTSTVLTRGSLHGVGVLLGDGGILINGAAGAAGALVTAAETGVYAGGIGGVPKAGAVGNVINFGTIRSTGLGTVGSRAIVMVSGGSVTNRGLVESAANSGISFHYQPGTVTNFGTIASAGSTKGDGVYLQGGGVVANKAGGRIAANASDAIGVGIAAGAVVNSGTIESIGGDGVQLDSGGRVTNQPGGLIEGGGDGINLAGGSAAVSNFGTVAGHFGIYVGSGDAAGLRLTNSGLIRGTGGTAVQFGNGDDVLVVIPGATFAGLANGGVGSNRVELADGSGRGTLSGLGSRFVDFGTIEFDAGSAWTLGINKSADFGETILGFAQSDTLDLAGTKATHVSLAKGVLTVSQGAAAVARFAVPGEAPTTVFHLASDGHGGTDITAAGLSADPAAVLFTASAVGLLAASPGGAPGAGPAQLLFAD